MVEYRKGTPRDQIHLFEICLDELIEEENIVRFIDEYVESLDMYGLGFEMNENVTGAPAYRPEVKLKIYIYGYMNRIRASRQLEQECGRNKELIWLTEGLAPDFKTIADFRRDNWKALSNVFKEFLKYCHRLGLISLRVAAIDGTKLRAQNGMNEVYRREKIEEIEKDLDERVKRYLKQMDELDEGEEEEGLEINKEKVAEITRKIKRAQKNKEKIEEAKDFFKSHPEQQNYCATDPDCRLQKDKGTAHPGYNAQVAVEERNKLIVVSDVTNENNDKKQLTPMVENLKEEKRRLGIEERTDGVADAGYYGEKEILKNKDDGNVRITVSPEKESAKRKGESGERNSVSQEYGNKGFGYERDKDVYVCPQGKELEKITRKPVEDKNGRETWKYRAKAEECNNCAKKNLCTQSERGRMLLVSTNKEEIKAYLEELKTPERKELIYRRKELVEHPFGTLKRSFGFTYFMQRGIEKVRAEFSFCCFIYNLKRVLKIAPIEALIAAL